MGILVICWQYFPRAVVHPLPLTGGLNLVFRHFIVTGGPSVVYSVFDMTRLLFSLFTSHSPLHIFGL